MFGAAAEWAGEAMLLRRALRTVQADAFSAFKYCELQLQEVFLRLESADSGRQRDDVGLSTPSAVGGAPQGMLPHRQQQETRQPDRWPTLAGPGGDEAGGMALRTDAADSPAEQLEMRKEMECLAESHLSLEAKISFIEALLQRRAEEQAKALSDILSRDEIEAVAAAVATSACARCGESVERLVEDVGRKLEAHIVSTRSELQELTQELGRCGQKCDQLFDASSREDVANARFSEQLRDLEELMRKLADVRTEGPCARPGARDGPHGDETIGLAQRWAGRRERAPGDGAAPRLGPPDLGQRAASPVAGASGQAAAHRGAPPPSAAYAGSGSFKVTPSTRGGSASISASAANTQARISPPPARHATAVLVGHSPPASSPGMLPSTQLVATLRQCRFPQGASASMRARSQVSPAPSPRAQASSFRSPVPLRGGRGSVRVAPSSAAGAAAPTSAAPCSGQVQPTVVRVT